MSSLLANACVPATFGTPSVFGAQILGLETSLVTNYSASVAEILRFTQPAVELVDVTFCNITVKYTHPGQDDEIFVEAWLPVGNWNGRLQAVGGGGWAAGRFFMSYDAMKGAIGDGYATITTNAGLGDALDASPWALLSPGNVNMNNLHNLGSVSLNDEAIIGKSLIRSFYGKGPDYSYWNGCSQGGRQGVMLAQRYPTAYDGIAAGAPVLYWADVFASFQWPQQFMDGLGIYPHGCELDSITAAAIKACDGLDGAVDGVIASPDACLASFDPFSVVGKAANCSREGASAGTIRISAAAAAVVNATWRGMLTATGKQTWHGLNPGADLTGNSPASTGQEGLSLVSTNCTSGVCVGSPSTLSQQWLKLFVAKDPTFKLNFTHAEFDSLVHASKQQYTSVINTDDPDLSEFKAAGGKLITFHGLSDNVISPKGTIQYYSEVAALIPTIGDFYHHYQIPGLGHCFGGPGGAPTGLFAQLRAWVENGTAPGSSPFVLTGLDGKPQNRILCPYPREARYNMRCGETGAAKCWSCVGGGKS
ncbi:tannase and feruloyl esterase [Cercophora scortea]|uniref:Carboxylic ester hydrolase n=1 Tax=Cercophora scortea TaxID=314031 RepID=A0AAE0IVU3_9PEZI|nr:tannase and feruloyl esterase [Cercophora scortea]